MERMTAGSAVLGLAVALCSGNPIVELRGSLT